MSVSIETITAQGRAWAAQEPASCSRARDGGEGPCTNMCTQEVMAGFGAQGKLRGTAAGGMSCVLPKVGGGTGEAHL